MKKHRPLIRKIFVAMTIVMALLCRVLQVIFDSVFAAKRKKYISFHKKQKRIQKEKAKQNEDIKAKNKTEDDKRYEENAQMGQAWFLSMPYEEVVIEAEDGAKLTGYYLDAPTHLKKGKESVPCILCVHGYRSNGIYEFGHFARLYHSQGYSVLLIDERGHGKSGGEYITFGITERYDVLRWLRWLLKKTKGQHPIYLHGLSMGASTVLMASEYITHPMVKGIIADCGFTSPKEIIECVAKNVTHVPVNILLRYMSLRCKRCGEFDLLTPSTVKALKKNKIPVLFIHGDKDTFVPTIMTRINYDACVAPKKMLIVKGATHAMSYLKNPKQYKEELLAFIE